MRNSQGIALQKSFIILSPKIENWSVFNEMQKQLDEPFFWGLFGVNRAKS